MKKILVTFVAVFAIAQFSYAQWTGTNPIYYNSGNVGIGTSTPAALLDLGPAGNIKQLIYGSGGDGGYYMGFGIDLGQAPNSLSAFIGPPGGDGTNGPASFSVESATSLWPYSAYTSRFTVLSTGNVGIGTTAPQSKFHINDSGTSSSPITAYSGNLIIQGNSGSRSATSGASLEFVVPANTDGTNPWGQARIITVAGNGSSGNATGELIIGTRRLYDKGTGTGTQWNYGDDLIIDGGGNIGVNTANTHGYKFAVNGSAIATSMTVQLYSSWPDYVFKPQYNLLSLADVKTYIDKNQHLPDMPSAQEVAKEGLNLGEMNKLLVKKVEELTLYLIEKDKQLTVQQKQIQSQNERIERLEKNLLKQINQDK